MMYMRQTPVTMPLIVLLSLLLVSSCGYHLSGTGDLVPKNARTIAIPVFLNKTNEPFVDTEVTKAVVEEFLTDGRLQVVGLDDADLALKGKVVAYASVPVSYTPTLTIQQNTYVQQYRVQIRVDAALEDLKSQKVLWEEKGIESVFITNYTVSYDARSSTDQNAKTVDIEGTKIGKEAAVRQASRDIASTLRSRVLEGF